MVVPHLGRWIERCPMSLNAVIGQSGGPTTVINSSLAGFVQALRVGSRYDRVLGMKFGVEGLLEERLVDLGREDDRTWERIRRTPSSALGSSRHKLNQEDLPTIRDVLERHDIRCLVLIGGNDTMGTLQSLVEYLDSVSYKFVGIGIPKTVDNDLYGTDHTPGFPSAARYVALSVQQVGRLGHDMRRVDSFMVHQTVGRDAGWLAAAAAAARFKPGDPPHLIYTPERPLDRDRVLIEVQRCVGRYGWCFIVCSEGIRWKDGTPVSDGQEKDNFRNIEYGATGGGSAAMALHGLIRKETGMRGEFQVTESLSMCAIDRVSPVDLEEAYACGMFAASLADAGVSGVMVSMARNVSAEYSVQYKTVPLAEVAERAKPMPDNFLSTAGNDVSENFLSYLRPLMGPMEEFGSLTGYPAVKVRKG